MTPSFDSASAPAVVPVRVVLPADPLLDTPAQEVVARLWKRQQTPTGLALPGRASRVPQQRKRDELQLMQHAAARQNRRFR
ncbi:hypothetical protein ABZZ74_53030 [Streptomyces sp. NPDC006476]|uniref:hypothetical protein n=1 Tax=Streptomyces sp. NPDC006476 TaxID=3157175 RepID=UPI0033AA0E6F